MTESRKEILEYEMSKGTIRLEHFFDDFLPETLNDEDLDFIKTRLHEIVEDGFTKWHSLRVRNVKPLHMQSFQK